MPAFTSPSQLRLDLRLLENGLHLGGLHDIALDLQLPGHEESLCVGLAANKGCEVVVGENQRNWAATLVLSHRT